MGQHMSGLIAPDHENIQYSGRIDFTNSESPILVWQGSSITIRFSGTKVAAKMRSNRGRNFFNIIIDGKISISDLIEESPKEYLLASDLESGEHILQLFKRTEAYQNEVTFFGFRLNQEGTLLSPPDPPSR